MNEAKEALRVELRQRRLNLEPNLRRLYSDNIVSRLKLSFNWSLANFIHLYEPIPNLVEVDIGGFASYIKNSYPKIKLYTSRKVDDIWTSVGLDGTIAGDISYDYIIVPIVGFDESLERIGQGGGYYDRFLSMQPGAKKIGVCFETGHIKAVPKEEHDVRLDAIVSEERIYY